MTFLTISSVSLLDRAAMGLHQPGLGAAAAWAGLWLPDERFLPFRDEVVRTRTKPSLGRHLCGTSV